jgi:formate hydrogenlyase subunit 3/multisubunit Na+/H+ antiporter MnhD subunit
MDLVPLHPKLVHLPIALAVLMPFLAGGISAAIRKEWLPTRAWVIVVVLQTLLLLAGLAAANTGESDEERVGRVVPHDAIEAHEDAANWFIASTAGVLALAVAAVSIKRPELKRVLMMATVIGTVMVMFVAQRVGELGGELVYVHNAAKAYIEPTSPPAKP